MCTNPTRGFTLLELLVAIAVFAILAVVAYGGLNTMLNLSHRATLQTERLTKIQTAVMILSQDFNQIVNRPIRDEFGDTQPSFLGGGMRGGQGVEFTRGGRRNPGGFARASLQRVGYTLRDGQLLRLSWQVLDRAQDSAPISQMIIDQVNALDFRFLDNAGEWHDQWPLDNTAQATLIPQPLPRAVEVAIDFQDLGRITRLYPLY